MTGPDQWEGLPSGKMYCWTWGKAPKYDKWNQPKNLFSLDQIRAGEMPSHRNSTAPTGFGIVSGRWSGTLAVDFDTKTERPEQSEQTFMNVTGHPSSDLPASATVISGRPGRRRIFLKVPEVWWPAMAGYSASLMDLELRWEGMDVETRQVKPIQSVVTGPHPDSPDWYFRWADGLRPQDVGFQDAPTWLLIAIVKQRGVEIGLESEDRLTSSTNDGPGYMDQLDPRRQKHLLELFSKYWPYRGGQPGTRYQASWEDDSFSGLLGALNNVLGPTMAEQWLSGTEWFDKNENWGCSDDFKTALKSVGRSSTSHKAGWGTLHFLATRTADSQGKRFSEPPAHLPKWALPPRELTVDDLASGVVKKVGALKRALEIIDQMEEPLERCVAYQNLSRSLEVTEKEMKLLLSQAYEADAGTGTHGGDWADVLAQARPIEVAIERLLAFNALTIVGSDGGVGKSVLIYRIAEAAANGGLFAGALQTERGNVLIIQKDESDSNLAQKNKRMQLQIPNGTVQVKFQFNAGMFPELRRWIREHNAKYVLMDSMVSLFGAGTDLSEGEIGTYMYLLNKIAADEGCAIVLTHHLRKGDKSKGGKRADISMSDLYGSAFIGAGTSDIWGIIRDPESDSDDPKFLLKVLKPRTGVTQGGDTFLLSGSTEDLSFYVEQLNSDASGVKKLRSGAKKLLEILKKASADAPLSRTELVGRSGMSDKTVRRLLAELMETSRYGVRRSVLPSLGNRPKYGYWAE